MNELHVLFRVGSAEYVLPAELVAQMESFSGATKVPGTPDHVCGLVQIRGRVVPVIDMRVRFGLPRAEPTLDSRIVVLNEAGRAIGLLVDSAREVLRIPESDFKPPPEVVTNQAEGFVKSVAQSGARMLMLIDSQKVIGEEEIHAN